MRTTFLLIVTGLLLTSLLPGPVQGACPCTSVHETTVQGDTIAMTFLADDNDWFQLKDGTEFRVKATYPAQRAHAGAGFVVTERQSFASGAFTYLRGGTGNELHLDVASDLVELGDISLVTPNPFFRQLTVTFSITTGGEDVKSDWWFILSLPEAQRLEVRATIVAETTVSPLSETVGDSGVLAGPDEMQGTLLASTGSQTVGANAGATGTAPDRAKERGFATMFASPGAQATGLYGIDGPGNHDDLVLAAGGFPTAFVWDAPPGDYRMLMHAAVVSNTQVPEPVALFFSVPLLY